MCGYYSCLLDSYPTSLFFHHFIDPCTRARYLVRIPTEQSAAKPDSEMLARKCSNLSLRSQTCFLKSSQIGCGVHPWCGVFKTTFFPEQCRACLCYHLSLDKNCLWEGPKPRDCAVHGLCGRTSPWQSCMVLSLLVPNLGTEAGSSTELCRKRLG